MSQNVEDPAAPAAALGLWDAVSIIVGIVVGTTIYQMAPLIFLFTGSPQVALSVWVLGGVVSFLGALCYAELATTYPRDGGDIVYLSRAYGRWSGFLFGWVQLTVILTGSIGAMAFAFANYGIRLFKVFDLNLGAYSAFALAGGAILLLTLTNLVGAVAGKVVQNVLTVAKVVGLSAVVVAGFLAPKEGAFAEHSEPFNPFPAMSGTALVFVLYAFGGWNDAAFVAAEVKNGRRNITRALLIGLTIITALYLLVNAAYINALGFKGAMGSQQIAADVVNRGFGKGGLVFMCLLVMVSALGAINGLIFTGARIYSTLGKDFALLGWMGGRSGDKSTPVPALITQGVISLAVVFLFGTPGGRDGVNWLLQKTATAATADGAPTGHVLPPIKWDGKEDKEASEGENVTNLAKGGFDTLVSCTAPIFWSFFLLTGISLFVLRERDPDLDRPFKAPFYPELPLAFCASCGYMLYSSIVWPVSQGWQGGVFLLGVLPLLIGLPLYHVSRAMGDARRADL